MCNRFLVKKKSNHLQVESFGLFEADLDVKPTDGCIALTVSEGEIIKTPLRFGIHHNGKLLLNARSETVMEKALWKEDFLTHKAIFPCSYLYEKTESGSMITYKGEDSHFLLLGFRHDDEFVLLTKEGDELCPRLPCAITLDGASDFLSSSMPLREILREYEEKLHPFGGQTQMKLF